MHRRNAFAAQELRIAHARELQQGRRIHRAAAHQDLAPRTRHLALAVHHKLHTAGALAIEHHALHQRMGDQPQIGPLQRRAQIRGAGRFAQALAGGDLVDSHALPLRAVDVIGGGQTHLKAGLQKVTAQRVHVGAHITHMQGAALPAPIVCAAAGHVAVFQAFEIGQHVGPGPAGVAASGPVVKVRRLAAHKHHAVDAAGPPQHPPARPVAAASGQSGVWLGAVHPVDRGVVKSHAVANRRFEPKVVVRAARLQQQHAVRARGAQAVGEHATGRSGADDDVVKSLHCGDNSHGPDCSVRVLHSGP